MTGPLIYRNNNMATVPAATRRVMAPNASKTECLLFMVVIPLMNSLGAPSLCRYSPQKQDTEKRQNDRRQYDEGVVEHRVARRISRIIKSWFHDGAHYDRTLCSERRAWH